MIPNVTENKHVKHVEETNLIKRLLKHVKPLKH